MTTRQQLQVPSFFDGQNAGKWVYRPDLTHLFDESQAWKGRYGVKPSAIDRFRLHLLLIDVQKDFCYPEGTLYVGGRSGKGAIEDNVRISEFIYRELPKISEITTTFDTHFAYQIFFPWFWVDRDGKSLSQHTMIRIHDNGRRLVNILPDGTVLKDDVKPNPAIASWVCEGNYTWLEKQAFFYCQELAKGGKYTLYLWPPHCILGSDGHALSGVVHEARQFHSFVRGNQSWGEVKGTHPLTENYSVLSPEVLMRWDGKPLAQKNARFIKTLLSEGAVVIAGQAASHCVRSSIDDLLGEILAKDPELAKKVYIMQDCMSSVVVPDGKGGYIADFTPQAEESLAKFQAAGMYVVDSTDPVESWPELKKLAA
ncbi:MAG: nicotinamidase [Patescibacteria group bacterium]